MQTQLEVILAPNELPALNARDLSTATCVVFDVLRATSSMVTALHNGAESILPVTEIAEALAVRRRQPEALLAGERHGLRITATLAEGIEFDLGNSPREFTAEKVRGRHIVMTTTNGTRALQACAHARRVLVGALLNLDDLITHLAAAPPEHLLLVAAGTFDEAAYEDVLAAGEMCDRLWNLYAAGHVADSALIARDLFRNASANHAAVVRTSRNAQRLLARPDLADDVEYCLRRGVRILAELGRDGVLRRSS